MLSFDDAGENVQLHVAGDVQHAHALYTFFLRSKRPVLLVS